MMASRLLYFASLISLAVGFSDTVPAIAWSSQRSNALTSLPSNIKSLDSNSLFQHLVHDKSEICNHDAVVFVEMPGLHASDLRRLSPSSAIARSLESAHTSREYPYIKASSSSRDVASAISSRCGSPLSVLDADATNFVWRPNTKHVVSISLPLTGEDRDTRVDQLNQHDIFISNVLDGLTANVPNYVVILAGTPSSRPYARQFLDADFLAPSGNDTLPSGGILKRYQLLTPALIMSLIVTFFVLVPIVLVGIKTLSSIQSTLRVEVPKNFSAQEKKNQ